MDNQNQNDDQNKIQPDFLDELGLSGISEEKKEELLVSMTEVLLKRIFIETMEKLSESDRDEYLKTVEEGSSPEKVEAFLKEKIPNYEKMVKEVVKGFKREMKG